MWKSFKRHEHTLFSALLTSLDFVVIVFTFLGAYYIRFYTVFHAPLGLQPLSAYVKIVFPIGILYVIIFERFGIYKPKIDPFHLSEIYKLLKGIMVGSLVVMSATFLYRQFQYSRGVMLAAFLIMIVALIIEKFLVRSLQAKLRINGYLLKNVLIVGTGSAAVKFFNILKNKPALGFKPAGFLYCENEDINENFEYKELLLGNTNQISEKIKQYGIEEVIVALPSVSHNAVMRIIMQCEKEIVKFRILPDIMEIVFSKIIVQEIEGIPFLSLKDSPLLSGWYFVKRFFDTLLSAIGLIVLSPLLLFIAVLVKKSSQGTVFYKQKRMGIDGKEFFMYKFRTMKVGAEDKTGPVWASEKDDRKTKIGDFLRRTNLDELPQLYNVFQGDMSLVGPRPERPFFVKKFKEKIPNYMSRHRVKSGITGWAQVNGLRGNTSLEDRIKYDLYYIENWSLLLDLKIILMTFFAHKNAY